MNTQKARNEKGAFSTSRIMATRKQEQERIYSSIKSLKKRNEKREGGIFLYFFSTFESTTRVAYASDINIPSSLRTLAWFLGCNRWDRGFSKISDSQCTAAVPLQVTKEGSSLEAWNLVSGSLGRLYWGCIANFVPRSLPYLASTVTCSPRKPPGLLEAAT